MIRRHAARADKDWYVEARGLVGKDFLGSKWGLSPQTGIGIRHLSNGIAGVDGDGRSGNGGFL